MKTNKVIDLRSDTVTRPTYGMWNAMRHTSLLDHILDVDPSTRALETFISEQVGKEEAIILSSGTMGNLIAIMTHTTPGDAIVLGVDSHINQSECGGMARLAGIQSRQVKGHKGYLDPIDIERNIILDETEFCAKATMLTLENPHNLAGGTVLTPEQMDSMCCMAKKYDLAVHLDGARLFNATAVLGLEARELTRSVDSVMISLSKGISTPFGAILAGPKKFIVRAMQYKKMLGGGMRQEGLIASAGIFGLKTMMGQLKKDNENASLLAEGLKKINGIVIDFSGIRTNIVFFKLSLPNLKNAQFVKKLENYNIKTLAFGEDRIRMVTHKEITEEDIKYVLKAIIRIVME